MDISGQTSRCLLHCFSRLMHAAAMAGMAHPRSISCVVSSRTSPWLLRCNTHRARGVKWSSSRSQARASSVVLRLCARGLAALTLACCNGVPGLLCFLSTHVANRPVASASAHGKAASIMPDVAGSAVASGTC